MTSATRHHVPGATSRQLYRTAGRRLPGYWEDDIHYVAVDSTTDANLISSEIIGSNKHAPVLDLDGYSHLDGRTLTLELAAWLLPLWQWLLSWRLAAANLIVSGGHVTRQGNRLHIELAADADLIGSSTGGNHHLYIDKAVPWGTYRRLLRAMQHAGVLQPGFVRASLRRGRTQVRAPWITKTDLPG